MDEILVSVIVPIYKVERFIGKCVTSLMNQTLQNVEFIFVDDASPDKSIEILKECIKKYPQRRNQVHLITHPFNKGLPSARNSGLLQAKGKYIFHCDSDDYMDFDMLEVLYNQATKSDSDIVWCDFYLSYDKKERYMSQSEFHDVEDYLRVGLLGGSLKYNVWNKLIRRKLYVENNILFPDGYAMGEDMTMIRLAACAKRIDYIPRAFYHYVQVNTNAYSNNFTEKHLNAIKYNVNLTESFLKKRFGDEYKKEISFFKLNTKLPFLITDNTSQYLIWKQLYPEVNSFIPLIMNQPFRTKVIQWLAWKGYFKLIWLYNILVYKIIYKLIYR